MDHRQALHDAGPRRRLHCSRRRDQPGRGDAGRGGAGHRDERDERLPCGTARQDRGAQRPCHHPGLWRPARQLAERTEGSARDAGRGARFAADRTAAAGQLQRPGRSHPGARQYAGRHSDGSKRRRSPAISAELRAGAEQSRNRRAAGGEPWCPDRRHDHHHQPAGPRDAVRHRARARSAIKSPRSSRSASTITTRRSSSCRCRTRRPCC